MYLEFNIRTGGKFNQHRAGKPRYRIAHHIYRRALEHGVGTRLPY